MKLIEESIRYPVTVIVGVILGLMFGTLAIFKIPKQLTPTVDSPQIVVRTAYPGAAPETVEQDITNKLEDVLRSVDGLREMTSDSSEGASQITLEYEWGVDKDAARIDVSEKLRRVTDLPEDADEPEVIAGSSDEGDAVAWMIVSSEHRPEDIKQFIDDEVVPRIERVEGVAQMRVFGGRDRQMQVRLNAARVAGYGLTLGQVGAALRAENRNVLGGSIEQDQQRPTVRTMGQYASPADILHTFVAWRGGAPIRVRDLVDRGDPAAPDCDVRFGFAPAQIMVRQTDWTGGPDSHAVSQPTLAMPVFRRTGVNVLEVMAGVRAAIDELNAGACKRRGVELLLAYDQTVYINEAIALVQNNVVIGGLLAIAVLLLFLRSASSTLVISFSIPISLVATFLVLRLLGRTLNIISLAGLAFASGMVVDNGIVVLENIYRHRQLGKDRWRAAYDGTREVWGAVFASTLTTLAVFIPVVLIQQEIGQLFEDIAITISTTVALSLIVSITVIPMLSSRLLRGAGPHGHRGLHKAVDDLFGLVGVLDRHVRWFCRMLRMLLDSWAARLAITAAVVFASVAAIFLLAPKAEYLPNGNQNLVFGVIMTPPGYGLDERARMAERIENRLFHTAGGGGELIERMFIVNTPSIAFMGARATDPRRVGELIGLMKQAMADEPFGTFGFPSQRSIFQRGPGGGRQIELRVSAQRGRNEQINDQAQKLAAQLRGPLAALVEQYVADPQARGDALRMVERARVTPTLGGPELQIVPHLALSSQLGLSVVQQGQIVNASVDGLKVDDYNDRGKQIDLVLRLADPDGRTRTQDVARTNVYAHDRPIPLSAVAHSRLTTGATSIQHIEQARAFSVIQLIPEQIPLQAAVDAVRQQVVAPALADPGFPAGFNVTLGRSADDLAEARTALQGSFILALVITYLLMSALFQSFFYPFVIMFSVPLAAVGGLLGLRTVNFLLVGHEVGAWHLPALLSGQLVQLDSLAMLGFIILIGIVVNNAILVVHQSLNFMRDEGLAPKDAIAESVRTRIRPIFMTTVTSLFGMAPLVIAPGAGSELYRAMGAVILFGLLVSTFFTLLLVPLVFSMGIELKAAVARLFGREGKLVTGPTDLPPAE